MTKKQFFIIVIITFITVCVWVISDIVHSRSQVALPPELQEVLEPIDPNFDLSGLQ